MEVDPPTGAGAIQAGKDGNVMATASAGASVATVSLHPVVIMQISEHWTRVREQQEDKSAPPQVIGAVIGTQNGRNLEIWTAFELLFDVIVGDVIIDMDYYRKKEDQFKQVFSDYDFLGWYTIGDAPNQSDIKIHKQICAINESPVFLKMMLAGRNTEGLPVAMFESVIDIIDGKPTMLFVEIPYVLTTEEAERIGADHVARLSASHTSERSAAGEHLQAQSTAIKMLYSRLQLILAYLRHVESGAVKKNHEVIRDICSLVNRLPVLDTDKFKQALHNQCNDVVLQTYLGMITKSTNNIHQFISKFNLLHDRQGVGRRVRPMVY